MSETVASQLQLRSLRANGETVRSVAFGSQKADGSVSGRECAAEHGGLERKGACIVGAQNAGSASEASNRNSRSQALMGSEAWSH